MSHVHYFNMFFFLYISFHVFCLNSEVFALEFLQNRELHSSILTIMEVLSDTLFF